MFRLRHSRLGTKIALAIFAPLALQTAMTFFVQSQLHRADELADKFDQEERVNRAANELSHDIFRAWTDLSVSTTEVSLKKLEYYKAFAISSARLEADLTRMERLKSDYPEAFNQRASHLDLITSNYRQAKQILLAVRQEMSLNPKLVDDFDRTPVARRLRNYFTAMSENAAAMVSGVGALDLQQSLDAARDLRAETRNIAQVFILLNGLLAALLFLFVYRNITRRINLLERNVDNLLLNKPLAGNVSGGDEIANLDKKFRKMAREVKRANDMEKAVVQAAPDPILTLDGALKVDKVNPAALAFCGGTADDAVGRRLSDIVGADNIGQVKELTDRAQSSGLPASADIHFKAAQSGSPERWVQFSVQWSDEYGLYTCILRDITERIRAEQLRDQVVAMISHDLRSPLTTLGFTCEILESGKGGELSERGQTAVTQVSQCFKQMMALVNDLLDLERSDAGMMELEPSRIVFGSLVKPVLAVVSAQAGRNSQSIAVEGADVELICDVPKMERVLTNLLSNAVKYSPSEGRIVLAARRSGGVRVGEGDKFVISVQDQGQGIPQEEKERVFAPYYQRKARGANRLKAVSSGLGLAICKAFAELHSGTIKVVDAPQGGSIFVVEWPMESLK